MLSNYKKKCESFVTKILQDTRYKFNDIVLNGYEEFIVNLNVEVINQLNTNFKEVTYIGAKKPKSSDELHYKKIDYDRAIQDYLNLEYEKTENFEYLLNQLSRGEYGKFKATNTLLQAQTEIFYQSQCETCRGEGKLKCDKCINGKIKCSSCGGYGKVKRSKQVNGKRKEYYEDCNKCRSTGKVECLKCRGSMVVKCQKCEATGCFTKIAKISIETKPIYTATYLDKNINEKIKKALNEFGLARLNSIADIKRENIKHSLAQKSVCEIYALQVPFANFSTLIKDKEYTWLVFGKNLQVFENDGLLKDLLDEDITALVEISKKFVFNPLKSSKAIIQKFMQNEVNVKIIEATQNGYELTGEIIKRVENAKFLSKDYIDNMFDALYKIATRYCAGVTINYLVLAFFISFIVALAIPQYGFLGSIAIFPSFIFLATRHKKLAFKKFWGELLTTWVGDRKFIVPRYFLYTIIGVVAVFGLNYFVNLDTLSQQFTKITQAQEKTKTQTKEKSSNSKQTQQIQVKNDKPQTQISSENSPKAVDYEQKFGKRIYLSTKDDFVNMRNAPSGDIIVQIYKKDFESIMIHSFDANSNEKWLKVMYFPPNVKDEQSAISGYIHISQIDKSKLK